MPDLDLKTATPEEVIDSFLRARARDSLEALKRIVATGERVLKIYGEQDEFAVPGHDLSALERDMRTIRYSVYSYTRSCTARSRSYGAPRTSRRDPTRRGPKPTARVSVCASRSNKMDPARPLREFLATRECETPFIHQPDQH